MPRLPRLTLACQAHHVIQRGNNKRVVFFCDADRKLLLAWLAEVLVKYHCALHAYVLMTNHIHLLITPDRDEGIGQLMQSLGRLYVGHINRSYGRTGTLWERRFKSTIVDAEGYVMACYRYIEANPVRAGMVTHAEDYPWSSYTANALGPPNALITGHEIYQMLGASPQVRQDVYQQLFAEGLGEEVVEIIRDATQRGWVPGSERFRRQIAEALGRGIEPPVRGRPRKVETSVDVSAGQMSLL